MNLRQLLEQATDKSNFLKVEDYADFCRSYLEFVWDGLQAVIVSQNETRYRFFQYGQEGAFAVTRPINSELMLSAETFEESYRLFQKALPRMKDIKGEPEIRKQINRFVYTCQQSIGATLDALPAGESNRVRKINGDLFERFIRQIIADMGIEVREGIVPVPVLVDGKQQFVMNYQHDLILEKSGKVRAIGSVKTSSKDRLDKIFIDKFLYNQLTSTNTPHFAVFLNDVQRKGREPHYGINATFLTGHYKGYSVKLNPLDGVYYCDIRPVMEKDDLLKQTIRTLDCLLVEDIWNF
ncbi:MAG: hypothetical protein ACI4LE_08085 [Faecalibacterium sp.]